MYFTMYLLECLRAMHEIRWNFKRELPARNNAKERLNKSFWGTRHGEATAKKHQHETTLKVKRKRMVVLDM